MATSQEEKTDVARRDAEHYCGTLIRPTPRVRVAPLVARTLDPVVRLQMADNETGDKSVSAQDKGNAG